ncbi:hypothetical protein [Paracoccus sp. (in: a-proteobacteria)]|uniref:hypothetical protein n=1 Tax=Paracoccus sp. TaxID=267 RepID=UPI00396CBF7E
MIGNLTENAVEWSCHRLQLTVTVLPDRLVLRIDNDGPGPEPPQGPCALIRWARLDGPGLIIVADLAALHENQLRLETVGVGAGRQLGSACLKLLQTPNTNILPFDKKSDLCQPDWTNRRARRRKCPKQDCRPASCRGD